MGSRYYHKEGEKVSFFHSIYHPQRHKFGMHISHNKTRSHYLKGERVCMDLTGVNSEFQVKKESWKTNFLLNKSYSINVFWQHYFLKPSVAIYKVPCYPYLGEVPYECDNLLRPSFIV